MSSIKVSFIVPVYNVEQFLPKCMDSILRQTVHEIEVICIHDCSPDNSLSVLKSFASEDSRVKVIDFKKNKGPGTARNAGLDAVSGEFVRMVDADDFIPEESTEKLLEAAIKYESNYVRGGFRNIDTFGVKGAKSWDHPTEFIVNTSVKQDKRLWRFDQHWAFLYRRKVLAASGARYDESMRNGQDAAFLVDLLPHLEKVTFIPETVYFYRQNPSSTMHRTRTKDFYLNVLKLYEHTYENMGSINVPEAADYVFYLALCYYLPNSILSTLPDNLDYTDAMDVLGYLEKILAETNGKKLCFDRGYAWQKKQQMPWQSKYITLMLCEGFLDDVYHDLQLITQGRDKEKHLSDTVHNYEAKLVNLYASTSWKATAPIRRLAGMLGKRTGR